MSELRGRYRTHKGPIETISKNPNKAQERQSLDRQYQLKERIEEWKEYLINPGARKLYVIVKKDLSPSQKAVQASHAAAQFQKEHPLAPWINGTMVLLTIDPGYKDWRGPLTMENFNGSSGQGLYRTVWREPDMKDAITAVCIVKEFQNSQTGEIKGLKLL